MGCVYLKVFVDSLEKYQKLNDAEFGRLMRAALRYKATGDEVKLPGREELLFDGMKLEIDRDNQKYAEVAEKRAEAGKKGADTRWQADSKNSKSHLPYGKNGQDKDKDKDKDKDNIILTRKRVEEIVESYAFTQNAKAAILDWLQYKTERRENYRLTGLTKMLSQIRNRLKTMSEDDVVLAISESMSCNYAGIIWNLAKDRRKYKEPSHPSSLSSDNLAQHGLNKTPVWGGG